MGRLRFSVPSLFIFCFCMSAVPLCHAGPRKSLEDDPTVKRLFGNGPTMCSDAKPETPNCICNNKGFDEKCKLNQKCVKRDMGYRELEDHCVECKENKPDFIKVIWTGKSCLDPPVEKGSSKDCNNRDDWCLCNTDFDIICSTSEKCVMLDKGFAKHESHCVSCDETTYVSIVWTGKKCAEKIANTEKAQAAKGVQKEPTVDSSVQQKSPAEKSRQEHVSDKPEYREASNVNQIPAPVKPAPQTKDDSTNQFVQKDSSHVQSDRGKNDKVNVNRVESVLP